MIRSDYVENEKFYLKKELEVKFNFDLLSVGFKLGFGFTMGIVMAVGLTYLMWGSWQLISRWLF